MPTETGHGLGNILSHDVFVSIVAVHFSLSVIYNVVLAYKGANAQMQKQRLRKMNDMVIEPQQMTLNTIAGYTGLLGLCDNLYMQASSNSFLDKEKQLCDKVLRVLITAAAKDIQKIPRFSEDINAQIDNLVRSTWNAYTVGTDFVDVMVSIYTRVFNDVVTSGKFRRFTRSSFDCQKFKASVNLRGLQHFDGHLITYGNLSRLVIGGIMSKQQLLLVSKLQPSYIYEAIRHFFNLHATIGLDLIARRPGSSREEVLRHWNRKTFVIHLQYGYQTQSGSSTQHSIHMIHTEDEIWRVVENIRTSVIWALGHAD